MVADDLGLKLRSCGEEIRAHALSLTVSIANLPDGVHEAVDRETVLWAQHSQPCLVEGRFLDAVFAGTSPACVIRLEAGDAARLGRARQRFVDFALADLLRCDQEDKQFRARMFAGRAALRPSRIIDTTRLTVEECFECVRSIIGQSLAGPT